MRPGRRPFGKKRTQPQGPQPTKPHPTLDTDSNPRSGGKLGAVTHNPGVSTGMHFGHHKQASSKPAQRAGAAAQFNRPTAPISQTAGAQAESSMADITYIPNIDAFFSQTMDVYSWGAGPPPIDANRRASGTNILITGTFPEGMRQKIQSADAYTHVIICDANIEIRDGYTGGGQQAAAGEDILTIPAGQKQNYWIVRFCFVTQLPGMGRKKILLVDRQATGNWPTMV